jgi:hypothetical protein
MEIEHCVKSFPLDENLQQETQKLQAEGWDTQKAIPPVVVYHLVRVKREPQKDLPASLRPGGGGIGELQIDDSKIFIRRAGE